MSQRIINLAAMVKNVFLKACKLKKNKSAPLKIEEKSATVEECEAVVHLEADVKPSSTIQPNKEETKKKGSGKTENQKEDPGWNRIDVYDDSKYVKIRGSNYLKSIVAPVDEETQAERLDENEVVIEGGDTFAMKVDVHMENLDEDCVQVTKV